MGDNVVSLIDLLSSVGLTVIISVFLFSVIKSKIHESMQESMSLCE